MSDALDPRGLSLTWKAIALLVAVGLGPAALVGALLANVNYEAVVLAERQRQVAVAAELSGDSLRHVTNIMDDTRAVAAAIPFAAQQPSREDDAMAGVKALLSTGRGIDAVRFEVPSAKVDTVLRREGAGDRPVPASTPALRDLASERGLALAVQGDGAGIVVVAIPPASKGGATGYVTARADLAPLREALADLAGSHFDDPRVSLLIADSSHRLVASHNVPNGAPGVDVSAEPFWTMLPSGTPWTERVGMVGTVEIGGERSVANVMTVPALGWAVAIWRPESVAYAAVAKMRRDGAWVGIGALVLAILAGVLAARAVTRPVLHITEQARRIGQRRWRDVRIETTRKDELGQLARSMQKMAVDLEAGEEEIAHEAKLRGDLSRFLSKELVERIVRGEHPLSLGGRRAEITVLFADVVAFTPLAENRRAEEVVSLLNELFSMLSEVIFRHGGMVDKFIGDCIMGVWGAPEPHQDHARRAVAAAEDMMRFLETAADEWRDKYDVEIRLGIGINTGEAIVGNIGSRKRMEYTVVGDVVNVASRLESIARPNQVLMGEGTHAKVVDAFETAYLGERNLTGRKEVTKVYELVTEG